MTPRIVSYTILYQYFRTNFALMQHHNYSLYDIENMMPWERDIYLGLLLKFIEEEKEQQEKQKNG